MGFEFRGFSQRPRKVPPKVFQAVYQARAPICPVSYYLQKNLCFIG